MDVRQVIGENIRRRRIALGLTQERLAAQIGVEQSYLSGIEYGRRNPTAVTIWHIALALKVKPGSLFEPPKADSKPTNKGAGRPRKPL
ncbi:helix-turn-helix transcriptional regulator [Pseudorhodoplanes sp.]|uniref:helix-turn-helix domain-containing protein n=1 Tax=Pseudorhodoplanes sp. TaxID=1934341 RepID=UPI002CE4F2B7|nr:helix-turn-helix transcriptional regulator [Pseudorhodoplanes sp.]HWV55442.1 helix-turn-helix transcriptional regulator [Pseudorhodoplanes sp.]